MKKIAVYPGSFDPITFGHLDIIKRASRLFSTTIVAVVQNHRKKTLFSIEERIKMIQDSLPSSPSIRIESFEGLLVNFMKKHQSMIIIRGLRAISDFEYEFQIALTNRKLADKIETIFLMPSEEYTYLSSSVVKEIASLCGDVSQFVPHSVTKNLKKIYTC